MATLLTSSQGWPGASPRQALMGTEEGRVQGETVGRSLQLRRTLPPKNPTSDWGERGHRRVEGGSPLPPRPAMWQLKEPSKPKCVCAHTQFITAEHMANILTHVSRARKTNRALRGGAAPSLRLRRPRARSGRVSAAGALAQSREEGARHSRRFQAPQRQAGSPGGRDPHASRVWTAPPPRPR